MEKENIVLLHGALGTKKQLDKLSHLLSSKFNVYSLDFDGHGSKVSGKEFSMELFKNNVVDFILEHGIEKTHVFGFSMGGYVALNLAKTHPHLISNIVTLGTKFNWSQEAAEKEVKMLDPIKIEHKVPKFAEVLKLNHPSNDWKGVLTKTAKLMLNLSLGEKLKDLDLQLINHKVLIALGTQDEMVGLEESEHAVTHLKNAQLKRIDGFFHPIEKNDMQVLNKIIEEFIFE